MPAGFRRHLVGKTLINVFHCDIADIGAYALLASYKWSCRHFHKPADRMLLKYITINLRPLTPHIMPCHTHKMAIVSWQYRVGQKTYQATYLYELLQMTHSRTGIVAKLFSVITWPCRTYLCVYRSRLLWDAAQPLWMWYNTAVSQLIHMAQSQSLPHVD